MRISDYLNLACFYTKQVGSTKKICSSWTKEIKELDVQDLIHEELDTYCQVDFMIKDVMKLTVKSYKTDGAYGVMFEGWDPALRNNEFFHTGASDKYRRGRIKKKVRGHKIVLKETLEFFLASVKQEYGIR